MNVHLGFMTTIAILCALVADFLFLPTLLMGKPNRAEQAQKQVKITS
jgi:predicted RND superfamily exporter protein